MKWFKHQTSASDDEFIVWLESEFGLEGYARWWKLLETIASQMDETDKCEVTYSWPKWEEKLKGRRKQLLSFLVAIAQQGRCKVVANGLQMTCSVEKLLEIRDNHSANLQAKNKSKNKNISSLRSDIPPLPPKEKIPKPEIEKLKIPDWIPASDWADFVSHRKALGKRLTDNAAQRIITKLEDFRARGHDPSAVLGNSIANGWTGVFEPKNEARHGKPSKHSGFEQQDYTAGLEGFVTV